MQFIDCRRMLLYSGLCVCVRRTGICSYIFHSPTPLFQFPYKRKRRELKNVQLSLKFVENESIPHTLGLDKYNILWNDYSDEKLKNSFLV